ncbi:hypothetical protein G6F68_013062 [Rhizopus microsporus]|nr:hypothetical protein G6F68_013062 [Rhizopus microsporus]
MLGTNPCFLRVLLRNSRLLSGAVSSIGFDDGEVGRDVEVARGEQAVVPHMKNLGHTAGAHRVLRRHGLDQRQDRIANRLESLGDQRRADGAGGVAAAQAEHATAPTHRHRRRGQQISGQVDHVLQVVLMAQPSHRRADQGVNLGSGQAHGPAHSGMQIGELGHADQTHAFA